MKKFFQMLPVLLAGFAGGMAGAVLMQPTPLLAAQSSQKAVPKNVIPLDVYNQNGKRVAYLGPGEIQQGTFFVYDDQQNIRIQMGSYAGTREKGQSLIGLHDRNQRLRLLFRLAGREDAPTLILKDTYGRDRMVIGLEGTSEEPYIRIMDKNGVVRNLLMPVK